MSGGTGVWWANLHAVATDDELGVAGFRVMRTVGTDHDVCSVVVTEDAWLTISGKLPPGRYRGLPSPDQTPALRARLREDLPLDPPPRVAKLPAVGDFLLVQEREVPGFAPERHEVRVKDLFLVEARPLDSFEPRMVELLLVDARAFYRTHGELTARWNVPGQGPGGRDPRWPAGKVAEILAAACAALPGNPRLVRCPDVESELGQISPHVESWGANPREVLDGLLEAYGLVWVLDLGGTCSIYWRGEGSVGEHSDGAPTGPNPQTYDVASKKGLWEGSIIEDTYSRRMPPSVPDEVLVVGGPSIFTAAIDYLVPVVPVQTLDPRSGQPYTRWVEVALDEIERLLGLEPPAQDPSPKLFALGELHGRPTYYDPATGAFVDSIVLSQPQGPALGVTPQWLLNLPLSQETDEASNFEAPRAFDVELPDHRRPSEPAVKLDRGLVENLRRNLLRFWRVPRAFRHLLPILDRAERYGNGERMPPAIEVYGWTQKEVDVTRQVQDQEQAASERLRREWQGVVEQIAAINARLRQIEILGLDQIGEYYSALLQGDFKTSEGVQFKGTRRGPSPGDPAAALVAKEILRLPLTAGEALRTVRKNIAGDADPFDVSRQIVRDRDFTDVAAEAILPFLNTGSAHGDNTARVALARGEVSGKQVLDSAWRWGKRFLKNYLGVANADDAADVLETKLKAQRDGLAKQAQELEERFNPVGALLTELRQIEDEIKAKEAATRVRDDALESKRANLRRKLDAARKQQRAEATQRIVALQAVNLPRREVVAKVADAEQGVFEIDEAAGWISDPSQPLSQALLVPMPVRAIFGTFAEPSFPAASAEEALADKQLNEFVRGAFESLAADPRLAAFASSTGHLLPEVAGAQVRFGFTPGDLSGTADVGIGAYRILAPDLRLEVALGGGTNLLQLVRQARAWAEAAMGLPGLRGSETVPGRGPQVLESGVVTVEGPRPVNPNGRISAVEFAPGQSGAGIDTRISFDSPSDPLPGVDHPGPLEDTFALRTFKFGLDPERFK